ADLTKEVSWANVVPTQINKKKENSLLMEQY
ncbi:MAG: hypothetical protein RL365_681, partial [Bacteroidota bacterium]